MNEFRTKYPCGLNDRVGDETVNENTHINVARKFSSFPRKHHKVNQVVLHKGTSKITSDVFIKKFFAMLKSNIKKVPNFIRISLSSMKKSDVKSVHQLLNDKLDVPYFLIIKE